MKRRNFSPWATHHIYQRCKDHGVLFYTVEDRLVYYTLAASNARKHKVKVCAASLMYTHIHLSVISSKLEDVHMFLHDTNTSFSLLYNHRYQRTGKLFERRPGHSQKITTKDIRSNIIYVYNNHVEKGLCSRAVEERWAFLAYALSNHPFSEELVRDKAGKDLRKALNLVDRRIKRMKGLEYFDLDKIFGTLSNAEREQFIDYVISAYELIDYSIAIRHFGSIDAMILATDSTTGGEYEIKEDYSKLKDTGYASLIEEARRKGYLMDIFKIPDEQKLEMIVACRTSAHPDHLRKFFHCDFRISRS